MALDPGLDVVVAVPFLCDLAVSIPIGHRPKPCYLRPEHLGSGEDEAWRVAK